MSSMNYTKKRTNYTKKRYIGSQTRIQESWLVIANESSDSIGEWIHAGTRSNTGARRKERQDYYRWLIGVLWWICELGCLDILVAVSLALGTSAWSLNWSKTFVNAFEYRLSETTSTLKSRIARYSAYRENVPTIVDEWRFTKCDWSEFYPDAAKTIPKVAPEARDELSFYLMFLRCRPCWL